MELKKYKLGEILDVTEVRVSVASSMPLRVNMCA